MLCGTVCLLLIFPSIILDLGLISVCHHSQTYEDNNGYIPPTYEEGTSSGGGLRMKLKEFHKRYSLSDHVFPFAYKSLLRKQLITVQMIDTAQHRSLPLTRTI